MNVQARSSSQPSQELQSGNYVNITQFHISPRVKIGKEIPESSRLEFLEKMLQTVYIGSKRQNLRSVKYKKYSRYTFVENTISNSPKVARAKFLGVIASLVLLA